MKANAGAIACERHAALLGGGLSELLYEQQRLAALFRKIKE